MDINYYMKIQNANGTRGKKEKQLIKINHTMGKHYNDTYDTEDVLINGIPRELMIIKDTDGNTYKKKIKSKHDEKFNLGDYVIWNNQVWLITMVDPDEKTWNRGYMYLCTVALRWQNQNGDIIERWGYSEDFTRYSTGVSGNNTIMMGDNQYGITLPIDSETKKMKRDMRFAIDFDDTDDPDIYKLTNRKIKLNDYSYFGRGGTIILTLSFAALNRKTDKQILLDDGRKIWICDYTSFNDDESMKITNRNNISKVTIVGTRNIKIGYPRTYTVKFEDENSNILDWNTINYTWNIVSNFNIDQSTNDNYIKLFIDDEDLIGSSFVLQILSSNKDILSEAVIDVTDVI